jgi:hypothetical protein
MPVAVFFRKFDEPTVVFDQAFDVTSLKNFVDYNSIPILIQFSKEYIHTILHKQKSTVFLFREPESKQGKKLEEKFSVIAEDLKGKILFAVSDTKVGKGKQKNLANYIGVLDNKMPLVVIVSPQPGKPIKNYMYTGDVNEINTTNIGKFIQ